MKFFYLKKSFFNFYSEEPFLISYNNTRQRFFSNNIYIFFCFFKYLNVFGATESLNCGSCMYFIETNLNILVESSIFYHCNASNQGGAIFIKSSNCNFILIKSCSENCTDNANDAKSAGQFLLTDVSNNNIHIINYTSVSFCENKNKYSTLTLKKGFINVINFNSSFNVVSLYSGIRFSESQNCKMSYSTFYSNIATNGICIKSFYCISQFFQLNIINNSDITTNFGILRVYSSTVYLNNSFLISNSNKLFYSSISSFFIINCSIQQSFLTTGSGFSLTLISTISNMNIILPFNHCTFFINSTNISKNFIKLFNFLFIFNL